MSAARKEVETTHSVKEEELLILEILPKQAYY